jgi:hypothetical protein
VDLHVRGHPCLPTNVKNVRIFIIKKQSFFFNTPLSAPRP